MGDKTNPESNLAKLVSISSPPVCKGVGVLSKELANLAGPAAEDLEALLRIRNGFYAFETALHVFGTNCSMAALDLGRWNANDMWRQHFDETLKDYLFFAEDIFGGQFSIKDKVISRFEPETGGHVEMSYSLDEWAARILESYEYETGYSFAHEWQKLNGPIAQGKRLLPKKPFVLGGKHAIENLYAGDAVTGMRFRGDIWRQIKDLPDGTKVRLRVK